MIVDLPLTRPSLRSGHPLPASGERVPSREVARWVRGRCRWWTLFVIALLVSLGAGAGAVWWVASLGPAPLGQSLQFSTMMLDRNGQVLRAYTTPEGRWRLPATRESVDPRFLDLLFAYEDKRFASHHGVDP